MSLLAAASSDGDLSVVLLGIARWVSYLGFVLLVGSTFFLTWLWPEGKVVPVFYRLMTAGAILTFLASMAVTVLAYGGSASDAFSGREGSTALARMALVALAFAFGRDVLASARKLRLPVTLWHLALIETYVIGSDAWGEPWQTVKIIATTGHLAATAAWLGGLLTLAAVLIPSEHLGVLHDVLPKFSVVAFASVIVLTVTGTLHALAIAGGFQELTDSSYGTVLLLKLIVFGLMLVLGNFGRQYAGHVAKRKVTEIDESSSPETVRAFAVAIGAEFALAAAVLAATAALVHVVPVGA